MRIILVDDHRLVTEMLSQAFQKAPDIEVVGIATNGEDGVAMARKFRPDVVLMDVEMTGISGVEAARAIVADSPRTKVVMLTAVDDQRTILDAMESGAVGYLTKDRAMMEDVADAVRRAHQGEIMLPTALIGRLVSSLAARKREQVERDHMVERLTQREQEILSLIGEGADNKTIAERLVVSPHTVRTHVQNLLAKLGAHSKLEALTIAARRGLVNLS